VEPIAWLHEAPPTVQAPEPRLKCGLGKNNNRTRLLLRASFVHIVGMHRAEKVAERWCGYKVTIGGAVEPTAWWREAQWSLFDSRIVGTSRSLSRWRFPFFPALGCLVSNYNSFLCS
jgi:hypothetical protein